MPRRYLEQLVIGLKNASLIRGVSGKVGGYCLTKPAGEIKIGAIIESAIGPVNIVDCVSDPRQCLKADVCECRLLWTLINGCISDVLNEFSLADMLDKKWYRLMSRQIMAAARRIDPPCANRDQPPPEERHNDDGKKDQGESDPDREGRHHHPRGGRVRVLCTPDLQLGSGFGNAIALRAGPASRRSSGRSAPRTPAWSPPPPETSRRSTSSTPCRPVPGGGHGAKAEGRHLNALEQAEQRGSSDSRSRPWAPVSTASRWTSAPTSPWPPSATT